MRHTVKGNLASGSEKERRQGPCRSLTQSIFYVLPIADHDELISILRSAHQCLWTMALSISSHIEFEILHPTPLSSINSSYMYIQFNIPLLVSNPPWACSRLPHILSLSLISSNHFPFLLFPQKLAPFLAYLLNSLPISLHYGNSTFITISQLPIPQILFHTKDCQ